MSELDFTLELTSEHLSKEMEYNLFTEAEERLRQLAAGHTDMVGAAISVEPPAHGETTPLHEVTVVVYSRPDHVAATQKEADPQMALKNALEVVERQIRERREKLKKHWEQPGSHPVEQEIDEVVAAETEAMSEENER